ncbi:HAD family hydrolase [Caldalkalibacillus mannanilyticus]|uniref:HAD family hydrolase n=1 Tax=Caldalkalibacillus mannanilyticus TaxID=1418 RepID=UPI00046805E4|nr:HAD family hydrolase [Caldalkalibacillus mannanilyticus]
MLKWNKIYFDLDNTLYSHEYAFERAIQDCYQDVMEEWRDRGLHVPYVPLEDWFEVFKYFSDYYWPGYEEKKYSQQEYRRKRYLSTMKHFDLPNQVDEADRFHEQYYEKANQYVQPYPGLYQTLSFFNQTGIEVGIITNGKQKTQQAKFNKLKLFRYIKQEHFFISEVVGIEKPDQHIFETALGNENPEKALFIGDTWEHDVVGALDASWNAIYLNTQNRPRTSEHQPLVEYKHFTQLLPFFLNKEHLNNEG